VKPEILERLNWYLLPPKVHEIQQHCGAEVAAALLAHCNNRRVFVPRPDSLATLGANPANPLLALEPRLIEILAQQYGGEVVAVPRAFHALLALRNQAIAAQHRDGKTAEALAEEYDLTPRRVWAIVASNPASPAEALAIRDARIAADADAGMRMASLKAKYKLGETRLRAIVAAARGSPAPQNGKPQQLLLF
jgi:Mor family transcriptional regulator